MDEVLDLAVTGNLLVEDAWMPGVVGVAGGRIVSLSTTGVVPRARRLLDRAGCWLLPGAIDVHVHTLAIAEEGIARATASAAAGGVTTILDMPYDGDELLFTVDRFRAKRAMVTREALVDVGLFATIAPDGPAPREAILEMARDGACALKVSMYGAHPVQFPRISDDRLYAACRAAAEARIPVAVHAENHEIVVSLIRSRRSEGPGNLAAHAATRPPVAEAAAIATAMELAHWAGAHLHIVHISIPRGVRLLERARHDGQAVTGETCLHYLLLTGEEAAPLGPLSRINPPLRGNDEREQLWAALAAGRIDAVASDHVPTLLADKQRPDIFDAPTGAPGVEVLLPLFLDEARRRDLDPAQAIRLLTEGPARCYGLYPRKGRLGIGADADLVAYDPGAAGCVDAAVHRSISGWSPYNGRRYRGRVVTTIARGRVVYDGGEVIGQPGSGRMVVPHEH